MKRKSPLRVPKMLGADTELGNSFVGQRHDSDTGAQASRLLLRYIDGIPGNASLSGTADPRDIGRKWLASNGSCCYIDMQHLEICISEVQSAWDFNAALHAQFSIAAAARRRAAAALPEGVGLQVLACNTTGGGTSWGGHINLLLTRQAYSNIFEQRLHYLLWLASYQSTSSVISGQGKVGAENGARPVDYQLSQRADFMEVITGEQTTFRRPLINSRDESLCGGDKMLARFHHIACDTNLCHTANVLKTGILQILLAMVESESPLVSPALILQEPVIAVQAFSHDPEMRVRQRLAGGGDITALELQRRYFDAASRFVAEGGCEGTVPRASEILSLWGETLDAVAAKNWQVLSRRLDWALKLTLFREVLAENRSLTWRSPEIKQLDLLYASLEPDEGLYYLMERAGHVDILASDAQVRRFVEEPPSDTRAYTRAHLLRLFGQESVTLVNWDTVAIRALGHGYYAPTRLVALDNPLGHTRAEMGAIFRPERKIARETVLDMLSRTTRREPRNHAGSAVDLENRDRLADEGTGGHYAVYYGGNRYGTH